MPCLPLLTGLAAILLHFSFLFFNTLVTWLLRFPEKERKAIIMMASQKNLPTAAGECIASLALLKHFA
jgi:predicted Na+-dependent transporter